MDRRRIGSWSLGWLSIIGGYGLGLLLIRGVYLGITRGFRAVPSQVFWIALGYLLYLCLAVYLFALGRRLLSVEKAGPQSRTRFGWGRIVLGAIFLYSYAVHQFGLIPGREVFKRLEPTNKTQAVTMKGTEILLALACGALIFWGLWRGFRPDRPNTTA